MRLETEIKLDYNNVLIRPKRSTLGSRKIVELERRFEFRNAKGQDKSFYGIPIIASNMDGVGTFEVADFLAKEKLMTTLVKTYSVQELVCYFDDPETDKNNFRTNYVAMSLGITDRDDEKFRNVYEQVGDKIKYVNIDVANGYSERFVEFVRKFRTHYPEIIIIAGNVVTGEMTEELILSGADIVKVGIGPGSVCTTRIQTGVGYPQLSAVIECADAAHGLGGHIIADGGCTCPGDVAKAFAGGADFVMLGGMLAGHDEGGGEVITKDFITSKVRSEKVGSPLFVAGSEVHRETETRKFVQFYGMSSRAANDKHFGGLKDYRASEGREVLVPYRGPILGTLQEILGGLRSTCTYAGANTLKQLSKCTTFIRCMDTHNRVYEK